MNKSFILIGLLSFTSLCASAQTPFNPHGGPHPNQIPLNNAMINLTPTTKVNLGPRAPTSICLRYQRKIASSANSGFNMELAYPYDSGLYSGYIAINGNYTCMTPYSWGGGPHTFDMYAHYVDSNDFDRWQNCTRSFNTNSGIKGAPKAYYYTAVDNGLKGVKCSLTKIVLK